MKLPKALCVSTLLVTLICSSKPYGFVQISYPLAKYCLVMYIDICDIPVRGKLQYYPFPRQYTSILCGVPPTL